MGFRFRRSVRLFPGLRLNLSRFDASASVGRRCAWLALGPRGARATVGIPGTGLSYSEQSPWARPKPRETSAAVGIDVTELPHVDEIEVPPARSQRASSAVPTQKHETVDDVHGQMDERVNADEGDRRLVLIALAIVVIVAIATLAWALLV